MTVHNWENHEKGWDLAPQIEVRVPKKDEEEHWRKCPLSFSEDLMTLDIAAIWDIHQGQWQVWSGVSLSLRQTVYSRQQSKRKKLFMLRKSWVSPKCQILSCRIWFSLLNISFSDPPLGLLSWNEKVMQLIFFFSLQEPTLEWLDFQKKF